MRLHNLSISVCLTIAAALTLPTAAKAAMFRTDFSQPTSLTRDSLVQSITQNKVIFATVAILNEPVVQPRDVPEPEAIVGLGLVAVALIAYRHHQLRKKDSQ